MYMVKNKISWRILWKKAVFSQPYLSYLCPLIWGKLFVIFLILVLLVIACITLESIPTRSLLIYQSWTVHSDMLIYLTFTTSFLLSFHIYILSFPFAKIVALINVMKLLCLVSYTFDNIFKPPIYRKVCQKLYPLLYHSWKFQVSPSLYILSCSYNQDFLFILQLILIFEN